MPGRKQVIAQLRDLGVEPGGILLVHTSFRSVAPVTDGPQGLIEALKEALGPRGTLVMPSMASDDDHVFDATHTPCPDMGIVAETFWRMPSVMRSDSPHAFAARGPLAAKLLAPHPIDVPHGLDSPVGRIYELDGQVLLLGVRHDANTTIHLAESLAGVRYRRQKHATVLAGGAPTRIDYGEIDHCCENFLLVSDWLAEQGLQRTGTVGNARALLMRSRDVVRVVTEKLRENMIMFLHAEGHDDQCDEARASIPDAP